MARLQTALRRITVDLTPLLPGGENGGAKPLARTLVRELSLLAPETHFMLLTSAVSHGELADLDAPNVGRECVDADLAATTSVAAGGLSRARLAARMLVNGLVPSAAARAWIKDGVWTLVKRRRRAQVASALPADLLFCPFTAPFFFDPRVPTISVVHDLQYLAYPDFFTDQQRAGRHRHFLDACQRADRLLCVSEFVRQTVLVNSQLPEQRVQTIHSAAIRQTQRDPQAEAIARDLLASAGIVGSRFLLYPANVWPHKNHHALLQAFHMFKSNRASSRRNRSSADLALVCTGAPSQAASDLQAQAEQLLPPGSFAFVGYLPEREFGALLQASRALIFPSLYEGFGLPVLEAMACDRPVLCSNATSLPEIAGSAAILFDPHDPRAIAAAIQRLETEPGLEASLVRRGRERVAAFGSPTTMAANYLAAMQEVVTARALTGASAVGQTSSR